MTASSATGPTGDGLGGGPGDGLGDGPGDGLGDTRPVSELLSRLDGLERQPLSAQVTVLDEVRRGLDEALARPVTPS